MMKKSALFLCLTLALGLSLSGCQTYNWTPFTWGQDKGVKQGIAIDGDSIFFANDEAKERALTRADYTIDLVRFTDARVPANFENLIEDEVIYEYMPEKIMYGVGNYMAPTLKNNLHFGKRKATIYKMEMDLKRVRTFIKTGDFFSGAFGKYVVAFDTDVIIRDKTSKVMLKDNIQIVFEKNRKPVDGTHPNAKQDKKNMNMTIRQAIHALAVKSAWALHKNFNERAKYYDYSGENTTMEVLSTKERLEKAWD